MRKQGCINPDIMKTLALCGHGDKILIADGNYPLGAKSGGAEKVYLGVSAGIPTVTQVLDALLCEINVEKAEVMLPEDGSTPEIFSAFSDRLGGIALDGLGRHEFYSACGEDCVRLAISSGEKRVYANLLITVGVA